MQIRHHNVGWVTWYVVYGVTGQDPQDEGNIRLMDYLAEHARSQGGLWVAAGDWNMRQEQVAEAASERQLHSRIVAPKTATCVLGSAASTIDFVVCHPSVAEL